MGDCLSSITTANAPSLCIHTQLCSVLAGCVRDLHISGHPVPLNSSSLSSSRVSFTGCPAEVVSGARFMGEGMALLPPTTKDVYHISFEFHSTQLASLLLYIGNEV